LKIVQAGTPVLRRRTSELTPEQIRSSEIQDLLEFMRETMRDAPGVGLAAPQVGLGLRLAVIEDPIEYHIDLSPTELAERGRKAVPFHVIINPTLKLSDAHVSFFEGCLSLAGLVAVVPRATSVEVSCLDHRGEARTIQASGWYARILQHEIDHLDGTLYVDRMIPQTLMTVDAHKRFWRDTPVAQVLEQTGSI
jgi:peptide deformylase